MSNPTDKIDVAAVAQGREGFERGVSLLTVIIMVMAADKGSEADEERALSYALGFAEALIDRVRRPAERAGDLGSLTGEIICTKAVD